MSKQSEEKSVKPGDDIFSDEGDVVGASIPSCWCAVTNPTNSQVSNFYSCYFVEKIFWFCQKIFI